MAVLLLRLFRRDDLNVDNKSVLFNTPSTGVSLLFTLYGTTSSIIL